jgi:cysteine desulfurase
MLRAPIYLDSHATTPVDPRVLEAMLPYFTETFGNPASSSHQWGWKAQEAVEQARRDIATAIGATAREIIFTSGATESNNLAITGVASMAPADRRHIVVSAIEHKSVLESAKALGERGWRVSIAPVQHDGRVDLDRLRDLVAADTAIVSVMAANNEIGVLQPMKQIAEIVHARGAVLHADAAPWASICSR